MKSLIECNTPEAELYNQDVKLAAAAAGSKT